MSLINWWPLNGNLIDSISGTELSIKNPDLVTVADSIFGKGYHFTTNASVNQSAAYQLYQQNIPSETFSISFWIKLDTNWSGWGQVFTVGIVGTSWTHIIVGVDIDTSGNAYFTVSNGTSSVGTAGPAHTLSKGIWYNIICTYDHGLMKMYVNGQPATKKASYSTTITPMLEGATTLTIGGNSTETGECTMCDVRVYSHVLSAHEIRDISNGLLIHYNFNDSDIETTTNYNVNSGWSAYGLYWTISERTEHGIKLYRHTGSTNTVVALSNSDLFANMTVGETWTFSGYLYVNNMPYKTSVTQMSTYSGFVEELMESREDGYFRVTFKLNNKDNGWIFHASIFDNIGLNIPCEIRYMQFEKGDHPTSYVLGSRSGYIANNSGLTAGSSCSNILYSSDTIVGSGCAVFNGSNSYIDIPYIKKDIVKSNWSVNFWIYSNDTNNNTQACRAVYFGDYGLTDGTKFNIEKTANGVLRVWLNSGSNDTYFYDFTIPYQEWTMVTITYSTRNLRVYKNGNFVKSAAVTINSEKSSGVFRLGRDNRSGDTTFNGKMADFKFYATVISDSTIAEEYKISQKIYSNGSLACNKIEEHYTKRSLFTPTGNKNAGQFIEFFEKDGYVWVQVMHHDNKNGTNLFSSTDKFATETVFHNSDCWSAFPLITHYGQATDGSYHFIAMDEFYDGTHKVQQWSQNTNPVVSTSTPTILSGSSSFGGLRKNGTNTFMSRPSNWWAATGCWTKYTGGGVVGIPGYYDQSHSCPGSMDLFVRVDKSILGYKEFKKGIVFSTEYIEK